jgi:hypothetical protein
MPVSCQGPVRRGDDLGVRRWLPSRATATARKCLSGPGPSRGPRESCLEPFRDYLVARFADDAHVDGSVLFREVAALGSERSYVTFVRELCRLSLRPRCGACCTGGQGVTTVIAHEPSEEIQWDWLELIQTPWGEPAHVLVHALAFSGKCRAVICEGESFPHLAEAIDGVLRRLGGSTRVADRPDGHRRAPRDGSHHQPVRAAGEALRRAAVGLSRPGAQGAGVSSRPPVKYIPRSWWRTPPVSSLGGAQADPDRWAIAVADQRKRWDGTIARLAAKSRCSPCQPLRSRRCWKSSGWSRAVPPAAP